MNIGIDLRALSSGTTSGVTVYIREVLSELIKIDKKNNYFLWWHSPRNNLTPPLQFRSPRIKTIVTHGSSLRMNLRLGWQDEPHIDRLLLTKARRGSEVMDIFWSPDPRPIALSADCRLVSTIHDLSPLRYPQFFNMKTRLWHRFLDIPTLIQRSKHIITVSEAIKHELVQTTGTAAERITATPLGVRADLRHPRASAIVKLRKTYDLPEKYVLSLSVLEPRKNLARLIRAFTRLKAETDLPHRLVLAGSADARIFADAGLARRHDWLQFTGFVPEEDKAALISGADAFAFPSVYEGFGLPVLEAIKCGTPVLASDIPALREVAGDAATFIDPMNIDGWKVALQRLLHEPKSYQKKAAIGIARAEELTWHETARKTRAAFQTTMQ